MNALKELVSKGKPHINSKIHVLKRQYVCLKNMLGLSGVGLNSTTYYVEALPEVWDAQIKKDSQLYTDVVDEVNKSGAKQPRC
ncbi:hypothetical protein ACS0TY_004421 [Phlomoides rotata]